MLPCSTATQTQEAPFKALSFSCLLQHKVPPAVKTGLRAKKLPAVTQITGVTFILYQRVIRGRCRRTHPEKTAHRHTLFLHTALCCSPLSKWRSRWFILLRGTSNAWHYLHLAACFKWYMQSNQSPCCWNLNNAVHLCVSLSPLCEDTLERLQETGRDTREDRGLQLFNTQRINKTSPSLLCAKVWLKGAFGKCAHCKGSVSQMCVSAGSCWGSIFVLSWWKEGLYLTTSISASCQTLTLSCPLFSPYCYPELTNSHQMDIAQVGAEFIDSKEYIIIWIMCWNQAQNLSLHTDDAYCTALVDTLAEATLKPNLTL